MRRLVASAAPLLLLLAACGSSDGASGADDGDGDGKPKARSSAPDKPSPAKSPSASPSKSPSASPSPTRAAAPVTSDPKDCFDADCRLKVSGPTTIRLDAEKFHYPALNVVEVGRDSLRYQVDYPQGGGAEQILGPGGSGSFGFRSQPPVEVKLESVKGGTALLALTPGKSG